MKPYYPGDPKYDPLFWLCLPIVLVCVVGASAAKVALAWLKTKLPSRKAYYSCCRDCGWRLSWDAASLICPPCQEARRQKASASEPAWIAEAWALEEQIAAAAKIKLFCCDVDLEYQVTRCAAREATRTRVYRCPTCSRIWLYITDWANDANSVSNWYPQQTDHDDHSEPYWPEKGTFRTKVYPAR